MNTLQRENSAKDSVVQQAKIEIEKLKKHLREKDVTISTISAKVQENLLLVLLTGSLIRLFVR